VTESAQPTTVGNYFVSNYPPFSFWVPDQVPAVAAVLERPAPRDVPLGLYIHIPFCRKRCDFCYFKVYTDKNSSQVRRYLDAVLLELDTYMQAELLNGRKPSFVYFGGGTPSYLSTGQLTELFEGLQSRLAWDDAREIAFECEPGTLQEGKAQRLKELGVTRLSLGVENFDAEVLELNNRAHRATEIDRAYGFIRDAGIEQVNIDLIAGMVGETEDNWKYCIDRTLELAPESVTLYQMEVPYNTTMYQRMKDGSTNVAPVADWDTKRRWVAEGFERLEQEGYVVGSAYTASRGKSTSFLYRDALWQGADMLGLGVSSFGHLGGVHYQNESSWDNYISRCEAGEAPVHRAYETNPEERLIREFILQLKLGHLDPSYFADKFGVDVLERFRDPLREHQDAGYMVVDGDGIHTTREGLMRIDGLLPSFFLEHHRTSRYV